MVERAVAANTTAMERFIIADSPPPAFAGRRARRSRGECESDSFPARRTESVTLDYCCGPAELLWARARGEARRRWRTAFQRTGRRSRRIVLSTESRNRIRRR